MLWLLLTYGHCFNMACIEVKKAYKEKGFSENDVPIKAIPGMIFFLYNEVVLFL